MAHGESVHTTPVDTTVMFADIARSTHLFETMGDEEAARMVMEILEAAASVVTANRGVVLRSHGDDVLCTFAEAADAAEAALAIHAAIRALSTSRSGEICMRIGINSGSALMAHGDLLGDCVNVAARLAAFAKAGQTIVSSQTLDALGELNGRLIRPVGEISLKGKAGPVTVSELYDSRELDEITQTGPIEPRPQTSTRLHLRFRSRHHRLDFLLVRFLLGRAPDCDLILDHPLVSRHHAEIRFENGVFVLRDFSTNGTVLISRGSSRSLHHSPATLRGRGAILLGRTGFDRRLEIAYHADGS